MTVILDQDEKLMHMFEVVHGELSSSCTVLVEDEEYEAEDVKVVVYKNGEKCWSVTRESLLFDYLTRDMEV